MSTLLIDTREQAEPIVPAGQPWRRVTMGEGDVSTELLFSAARIERKKNAEDLAHSLGRDHARLFREAERLKKYAFLMIVVEADFGYYLDGRARSRTHPNAICGSVCSLFARFGCPVLFAHDAATSWRMILGILRRLEEEHTKSKEVTAA
jgi:ERCC4-type nuclease